MESCLFLTLKQQERSKQEFANDSSKTIRSAHHQRLVPLTTDIKQAMVDFNGSHSKTSLPHKAYNKFQIKSLLCEEVQNIHKESATSENFKDKAEIDELIENYLKDKVVLPENGTKATTFTTNSDVIQGAVDMYNENDKNKLMENFQLNESRLTDLEIRILNLFQAISKLRVPTKFNTEYIMDELKVLLNKTAVMKKPLKTHIVSEFEMTESDVQNTKQDLICDNLYPYNNLYYEQRMNTLNLLKYKKSIFSMDLNKRAYLNPRVKPLQMPTSTIKCKAKLRSMFIRSNQ